MKKTFIFNKIIRDKCVKQMLDAGVLVKLKKNSSKKELLVFFKNKIVEEANELFNACSKEEMIEELADLLEVIYEFPKILNINLQHIETIKKNKKSIKGGFSKALIVDTVCLDEKHGLINYFRANPKKYPEK